VHRYYYSGDKEFQGPLLQGGPTVVVASHPVSGERMYIEATLPSGAPIIAHNKARITYIYPDRCVSIHFHRRDNCQAAVKYHGSRGIWRQTVECSHETGEKLKECMVNSPTVQSCKDASCAAGTALLGVKQAIDTSVACLIDRVKTLPAMVPGVTALASMGQDREQRNYENQIRSAARQKNLAEPTFLPTNR
jgi:hypothetical protein